MINYYKCCISNDVEIYNNLYDTNYCKCINDHVFNNKYLLPIKELKHEDYDLIIKNYFKTYDFNYCLDYIEQKRLKAITALKNNDYDTIIDLFDMNAIYNIPEYRCPICTFNHFKIEDLLRYIFKDKLSIEHLKNEIRTKFKNYKDFNNYLKDINYDN